MNDLKLSLILPIYNGKDRVLKCIKSILNQSYKNIELILIDDGSKDHSYEVIEQFLKQSYENIQKSNIQLLRHENQGVAKTRNLGIDISTGDYVGFVDQDDFLSVDYCKTYMEKALQTNADVIVGGYQRVSDENKVSRVVKLDESEWSPYIVTAPWAHVYKKSLFIDTKLRFLTTGIGEDVYFNLMVYSKTKKIQTISNIGYMWVNNPKSVSNSKQKTINDNVTPLLLLNRLMIDIQNKEYLNSSIVEYFFLRYVCWYLLFSARGSKKSDIKNMSDQLFEWLNCNYPNYRNNKYLKNMLNGEPISIRFALRLFYSLEKKNLLVSTLCFIGQKDK